MRCLGCKGTYKTRKGTLRLPDDHVGLLVVPDAEYFECQECGDLMSPLATATKIGDTRDRMISEFLRARPANEFISATEAAAFSTSRARRCRAIGGLAADSSTNCGKTGKRCT